MTNPSLPVAVQEEIADSLRRAVGSGLYSFEDDHWLTLARQLKANSQVSQSDANRGLATSLDSYYQTKMGLLRGLPGAAGVGAGGMVIAVEGAVLQEYEGRFVELTRLWRKDGGSVSVLFCEGATAVVELDDLGLMLYDGGVWQQVAPNDHARYERLSRYSPHPAPMPLPILEVGSSAGGQGDWQAVFMLRPDYGWAVGDGGSTACYSGLSWKLVASPTEYDLEGVWVLPDGTAWACGRAGTLLHHNGAEWLPVKSPSKDELWDIYMVNEEGGFASSGSNLLHFDKGRWRAGLPRQKGQQSSGQYGKELA